MGDYIYTQNNQNDSKTLLNYYQNNGIIHLGGNYLCKKTLMRFLNMSHQTTSKE